MSSRTPEKTKRPILAHHPGRISLRRNVPLHSYSPVPHLRVPVVGVQLREPIFLAIEARR